MTDLAPAATETVAPAIPAPRGSAGSAWLKWLARRIGLAILTLWLCSVLVFFATAALGDPVRAILGKDYASSPERAAALAAAAQAGPAGDRALLRLARRPAHRQPRHLDRQRAAGRRAGRPRIVNSAVLVLISAIVMIPLAFGIAMISANYRGKRPDDVIQVVMITLAGLPEFVVGILLVALFSTTVFHVLPAVTIAGGGAPPWSNPASMILPVLTLVIAVTPYVSRIVRSSLLEVLDSDYVELARLKGVPERVVMRKHALLNAIVPGIQVIALQLAWLAGGMVIVEYLFSYPGIGARLVDSVRNSDFPMVQVLAMVIAAVYVGVNLIADILSILFTPRARTAISS